MGSASAMAVAVQGPPDSARAARSDNRADGRGSARPLVIFVYGTGVAIGLHLALIHLYLWRSLSAFFFFLGATLAFNTATLLLWHSVLPRFSDRPPLRRLAWQALVCVITFTCLSFLSTEVNAFLFGGHSLLRPYTGGDLNLNIPAATLRQVPLVYSLIPIVPSAVLCVVGFNLHWWRIFQMQGRERELRDLATAAQLAALRAQVNPHFLFNSLNSIAQLISSDPAKAEACVERLAEMFRYVLTRSRAELVPLGEELEIAEAYLDIERVRFGEDLVVHEEIDERARPLLLPGLILQPLSENAVKHGIAPKIGGGSVLIRAVLDADALHLTVRDTGVGIRGDEPVFARGVGLRNVRDRLLKLYGPEATPAISTVDGEGTTVSLRIPVSATAVASRSP